MAAFGKRKYDFFLCIIKKRFMLELENLKLR